MTNLSYLISLGDLGIQVRELLDSGRWLISASYNLVRVSNFNKSWICYIICFIFANMPIICIKGLYVTQYLYLFKLKKQQRL